MAEGEAVAGRLMAETGMGAPAGGGAGSVVVVADGVRPRLSVGLEAGAVRVGGGAGLAGVGGGAGAACGACWAAPAA